MRRISAIIIALILILSCVCCTAFAENVGTFSLSPDHPLRILIVADPQDIDTPQPAMLSLLNASLDAAKPDLVVFLGDMTPENEEKYGDGAPGPFWRCFAASGGSSSGGKEARSISTICCSIRRPAVRLTPSITRSPYGTTDIPSGMRWRPGR